MSGRSYYGGNYRSNYQAPPKREVVKDPLANLPVQELRKRLEKQLHFNSMNELRIKQLEGEDVQVRGLKNRVRDLQNEVDKQREQNQLLVQELKRDLEEVTAEKETMTKYGTKLFNEIRHRVNEYVADLYQENEELKMFSREQQAFAFQKYEEVEEMEKSIQGLKEQMKALEVDSQVSRINLTNELQEYKSENSALKSQLRRATEEAESKATLLTTTQSELQKEQEEKQVLQTQFLVLKSALAERRQTDG